MTPPQGPVRPGAKVPVSVEVTDPKGRPVRTELALSLVDEALLSIYPDRAPAIGTFFYGTRRETSFRTLSSCTWAYKGRTTSVSAVLLAEERRLAVEDSLEEDEPAEMESGRRNSTDDARTITGGAAFVFEGRGGGKAGEKLYKGPGDAMPGARRPSSAGPATPGVPTSPKSKLQGGRMDRKRAQSREKGLLLGEVSNFRRNLVSSKLDSLQENSSLVPSGGSGELHFYEAGFLPTNEPRTNFSETGGWISAVTTDGRGKARVEFDLPDSTTAWKIKARGVTANSYVGEGEGGFKTTKQLQVSLVVPPVLTEGDEVQATARVHNLTGEDRDLKIELSKKTSEGLVDVILDRTVSTKAHREGETGWKITAGGTADLILGMKAEAGALEDEVEVRVPVRPFGMEHRDGRSGSTTEQANFELSLPEDLEFGRLGMVIEIGPDPGRDLVAAALGAGYQPFNCRQILATNLALASRGLAALRVLEYIEGRGSAERADVSQLRGVVASVLARLVSSQGKDGGLSWVGGKTQDIVTTSQAAMFFALADRRGLPTAKPALNKAVEWLLRAIRSSRGPSRVHAAHGLAVAGRAGFDALNALHRGRASFGLGELARLALAWQAQQRASLSAEVLRELRSKMKLGSGAFGEQKSVVPAADVEAVGLAAAALLAASATDSDGRRAIDWLKSRRRGASWGTPEATAAALQALVAAGGSERSAANRVTVLVTVNGQKLDGLSTAGMNNSRHDVPTDLLKPGGNEVVVALSGRGTVHYSAVLTGFASEFRAIDRREDLVTINRDMLPAYRRHDGKVVRPGFSSVQGRIDTFKNKLEWLRAGKSGRVETRFTVKDAFRKIMTPLVIEEPIPAGCSVPRSSVQGSFDHMIMEPDRITFFYREGRISDRIRYELQARFPGEYRVLPTRVFGASRPDLLAHGEAAKFTVKPSAGEEVHPYRMSPDELYQLGKAHFDAEDTDAAGRYLDELLSGWHRKQHQLRQTVFKDVARMMLFISIARGDDKATVKFFEDLKDLHEALVIPFDKIVAVGKAYLDIGEFERSLMVFKGTAEASFLKEAGVATTLEKLGELKASIGFLRKLLADYPDLNTMRLSLYSIGQKLAEIAARMPEGAAINEKIGRPAELRAMAVAAFREFLLMYPDDPLAEEVSFAWTTTHVEGKSLKQALEVAQKALDRYPASTFEDELLYTVGFIKFALGSHKEAQSLLRRVAEEQFVRPGGGRGRSENRYESIYLQGQIHHALGRPAEALAAYAKVKDRFSDAVEASDYFQRKDLTLPEVETFGLDEKVELPLGYRNIKEAQVKVYRVDLMRLYLLKKSLNDIRGIKLHGIRAYTDKKIRLGNGKDYKSVEKKVSLDLKEPGAYLVVARGGDLLASGMVLRSDLKIESQESLDVGRMRVNVKRGDDYLAAAHVKVIGSGDQRFRSGDTDLRGILVADDLIGRATVIVRKDDQYAFYRGEGIHQPSRYRPPTPRMPTKQVPQQQRGNDGQQQFEGWGNNFQFNSSNRARQTQWLQNEVMQKEQRGVEVYRTK
ncbi:MAG: alpha-2-macroglobulin family protein [Planctomycetota bacterium]|nr:alpha-2-macroglobulin family protein [Planctomycetota bacterium]